MMPVRMDARLRAPILAAALTALLAAIPASPSGAFPVGGRDTVLPAGSELDEDALDQPREIFRSEAMGGGKSYLVRLGDMAFSAPSLLGDVARRAGISCNTCHNNGAGNARLYIPGLSSRPGTFDTSGALFNPLADNGVLDALTPPSLRGARQLAPYGHDGRTASLRDFVRNVIVGEFAGPEPSPMLLDALVAYINEIDFLPNPRLAPGGMLAAGAGEAERRGEALFRKPFPQRPELSCAACHVPSAGFVDHRPHDVGSGGLYKTPTLLNADFNAPYFHDGRYDSYAQVVAHFDRVFELRLSAEERNDLVAYLDAIGDGIRPYERDGVTTRLKEINEFASVLETAIPGGDHAVVALTVDTVGGELRELTEEFPDRKDATVEGGQQQRAEARAVLKDLVLDLRRIETAMDAGHGDEAAAAYLTYRKLMAAAVPALLTAAAPYSLFNPAIHDAHYATLRRMLQAAEKPQQ